MFGIFGGGSGLTPAQMAGAYEVCKSGRNRTDSGDSPNSQNIAPRFFHFEKNLS